MTATESGRGAAGARESPRGPDVDLAMADNIAGEMGARDAGADELRRSRTRLLLAADADRRAIESALHDGLQQDLVALAFNLRRARALLDDDPSGGKALLAEVEEIARESISEAASLAQQIYPAGLLDGNALRRALEAASDAADVSANVEVSVRAAWPRETLLAVYWCCLDALSAALARTEATVRIRDEEGGVRFEVGLAVAYPDGPFERLSDRVEALGGRLTIGVGEDGRWRVAGIVASRLP